MFLVDKPYISEFLKNTIKQNQIPVVGTKAALELDPFDGAALLSEETAIRSACGQDPETLRVYTTSENTIGWIAAHLSCTEIPGKIELFKDKVKFRKLIQPLFPDFKFREVKLEQLKDTIVDEIAVPFIVKPAVGFFSLGVHKIARQEEWRNTVDAILREVSSASSAYPQQVLDTGTFILEECIPGEEYAFDAYYDSKGNAVILGIFKHIFSSEMDVSDRVYTTSRKLIEEHLESFTQLADRIGKLAQVRNFPVHIEVRVNPEGAIPIEVNPMRFGGWCTTADLTSLAFGFNPYLFYYHQQKPDWDLILQGRDGKLFSLIVLDNSTGLPLEKIQDFDYEHLLSYFEKPLELRRLDPKEYGVFGFLFTETREENPAELTSILHSNLKEFVTVF